ncbi:MAG: FxsA family protein [Azospirillaceae bacterium]
MGYILIALIVVPLAEIAVFIQVGGLIGLWPTLAAILGTAVLGGALLRAQGLKALSDARTAMERQETPIKPVFDVICLFVSGAFLLTPGFITDAVGFALLVPGIRRAIGYRLWEWAARRGTVHVHGMGAGPGGPAGPHGGRRGPDVVDADFTVIDGEGDEGPGRGDRGSSDRGGGEDAREDGELPPVDKSRWGKREG